MIRRLQIKVKVDDICIQFRSDLARLSIISL